MHNFIVKIKFLQRFSKFWLVGRYRYYRIGPLYLLQSFIREAIKYKTNQLCSYSPVLSYIHKSTPPTVTNMLQTVAIPERNAHFTVHVSSLLGLGLVVVDSGVSSAIRHLKNGGGLHGVGIELLEDSATHQRCSSERAHNQEVPNVLVPDSILDAHAVENRNSELAQRGSHTSRAVDDTGHGSQGLVVALNGRIVSEIGGDGRGDDIVRATHQAAHESQQEEKQGDGQDIHKLGEDQQKRAQDSHEGGNDASAAAAVQVRHPSANDSSRHHSHGVERGDHVRGGGGEVGRENDGQLKEHSIVDLRIQLKLENITSFLQIQKKISVPA